MSAPRLGHKCNTDTVVRSIELQGNRGGTGKSRQTSQGTGLSKLAGAAPLIEAPLKRARCRARLEAGAFSVAPIPLSTSADRE